MIAYAIITFRETLEVGLVITLIWRIIKASGNTSLYKWLQLGILAGVLTSVVGGIGLISVVGALPERYEEIFEGIVMLIGAGLLTTLIVWLSNNRNGIHKLKESVTLAAEKKQAWCLFFLVYTSVLREGIESVIFLRATFYITESSPFNGALIGIGSGIILCYALFKGMRIIPLRHFFTVSSWLLILFAAGLLAHGINELQGAGIVSVLTTELWNLNPAVLQDGVYPAFHEKGVLGSLMKGLFGYNGNPTQLELLVYFAYISIVGMRFFKRRSVAS